jgi:hypothetical protein
MDTKGVCPYFAQNYCFSCIEFSFVAELYLNYVSVKLLVKGNENFRSAICIS